jgi:hypothetical protein
LTLLSAGPNGSHDGSALALALVTGSGHSKISEAGIGLPMGTGADSDFGGCLNLLVSPEVTKLAVKDGFFRYKGSITQGAICRSPLPVVGFLYTVLEVGESSKGSDMHGAGDGKLGEVGVDGP